MDKHTHGPDGEIIIVEETPPEVAEAEAVEQVAESAADASVEVAKVQARRDVTLAREDTKRA
jgi:DNA gyrase/topoisomerase IV subunit A